jgi:hypothetical protein
LFSQAVSVNKYSRHETARKAPRSIGYNFIKPEQNTVRTRHGEKTDITKAQFMPYHNLQRIAETLPWNTVHPLPETPTRNAAAVVNGASDNANASIAANNDKCPSTGKKLAAVATALEPNINTGTVNGSTNNDSSTPP